MVIYLTYNDAPSGIFTSQVVDVVKFMQDTLNKEVRLVSFISIRNFSYNKKRITDHLPGAIVLPMFPKMKYWRYNSFLLSVICFFIKPRIIIGRSVLATKLALIIRKRHLCEKVIYDGRGAIAAEWKEYKVVTDNYLLNEIENYERDVIFDSDYRIAVSKALSDHWQVHFKYNGKEFVNIPCTVNFSFENLELLSENITAKRHSLNYNNEDIIFIYSGSLAGWQSFELVNSFLTEVLLITKKHKILFLSREDNYISGLKEKFPGQVQCIYLLPEQVQDILQIGDYGILIREKSVTNLVASPVKYAEYLACGLKVIISEELGDYTRFTLENNCGSLFTNLKNFERTSQTEKFRLKEIARNNFIKNCFSQSYLKLLSL